MKPSLSQIEAFYWIAQLGGFHNAAAFLNLTQPTVSLRIRSLEAALGARLFERAGRQIRLTSEGVALLPRAERMMNLAEEFTSGRTTLDPLRGQLRLGAPDSFGLACLPDLLRTLREQYPELSVALTIDNSTVLSQRLNERTLDIAFLADPQVEAHIRTESLGTMQHAWVASPQLRLPRIVTPADLAEHDVLTNPMPSNLMRMVQSWFATNGLHPARVSTCNSLSVILRLAAAGAGIALLPTAILPTESKSGSLRVLRTQPEVPRQRFFAAYLIEKAGPGVRAVLATARQVIAQSSLLA